MIKLGRRRRVMILGSGELGKEIAISLKRFGVTVAAVDKYNNAPAMSVSDERFVINMNSPVELEDLINLWNPDTIIPEIEAVAVDTLVRMERMGVNIVPSASATYIAMNRKRTRQLVAEKLKHKTSRYRFADTLDEYHTAVQEIGIPCVVKPNMSSSGKGQTVIKSDDVVNDGWSNAISGSRGSNNGVIVEEFINFDYEITLLVVNHLHGVTICDPIVHIQVDGDYRESFQTSSISAEVMDKASEIANDVVMELGGYGVFGLELFITRDNNVLFSEISPRPHDTGMVTMISQRLSEFDLHARAVLELPIPSTIGSCYSASRAILVKGPSKDFSFIGVDMALDDPDVEIRIFGKPELRDCLRRVGVCCARGYNTEEARRKTEDAVKKISVVLHDHDDMVVRCEI